MTLRLELIRIQMRTQIPFLSHLVQSKAPLFMVMLKWALRTYLRLEG